MAAKRTACMKATKPLFGICCPSRQDVITSACTTRLPNWILGTLALIVAVSRKPPIPISRSLLQRLAVTSHTSTRVHLPFPASHPRQPFGVHDNPNLRSPLPACTLLRSPSRLLSHFLLVYSTRGSAYTSAHTRLHPHSAACLNVVRVRGPSQRLDTRKQGAVMFYSTFIHLVPGIYATTMARCTAEHVQYHCL